MTESAVLPCQKAGDADADSVERLVGDDQHAPFHQTVYDGTFWLIDSVFGGVEVGVDDVACGHQQYHDEHPEKKVDQGQLGIAAYRCPAFHPTIAQSPHGACRDEQVQWAGQAHHAHEVAPFAGNGWAGHGHSAAEWGIDHAGFTGHGSGIIEATMNGTGTRLAGRVHGQITNLQVADRHLGHDAVYRFLAGRLRCAALTDELYNQKRSDGSHDRFSEAGCGARPEIIVHKQPRSNNGAVADAPPQFETEATGGAGAGQVAIEVLGNHPDGVVVLHVDDGLVFGTLPPILPCFFAVGCEQVDLFKPFGNGVISGTVSSEQYVGGVLHDGAGHFDGVGDVF